METEKESKSEYLLHPIFNDLKEADQFYSVLSMNIIYWVPFGLSKKPIINYDSYFVGSMAETISSITKLLKCGHIADACTLVRRFDDLAITNVYIALRLEMRRKELYSKIGDGTWANKSLAEIEEATTDKAISAWMQDKLNQTDAAKLFSIKKMLKTIERADYLRLINTVLEPDSKIYATLRQRLDNYVHSNSYSTIISNDRCIYWEGRMRALNQLQIDLRTIIIRHLSYLFSINDHYLLDQNVIDTISMGMQPEPGAEFSVDMAIQEYLRKTIYKFRPDIAKVLIASTKMRLMDFMD